MNSFIQKRGITLLSGIGALISIWQTRLFYKTRSGMGEFQAFCNIGQTFDCTAIEMSPYAELLGWPLSTLAIAGYLMIFVLSFFAARKLLQVLSVIALVFSGIYLAIMLGVIGKLCLLCLIVDSINALLFVLALRLPASEGAELTLRDSKPWIITAASVGASLLISLAMNPLAEMKSSDMNDLVESVLNAPVKTITVPADAPSVGPADAKITIVKFSDYQCPACKMAANAIHPLAKRYPKDVRFVFVNFPLDSNCNSAIKSRMHEAACEAAYAAHCAQEQNKFGEVYEALFENQKDLKAGGIVEILKSVPGINTDQLQSCMTQASTSEKIKRDVDLGISLPIQSTPTFFINGRRLEGGLPTHLWIKVIDALLAR